MKIRILIVLLCSGAFQITFGQKDINSTQNKTDLDTIFNMVDSNYFVGVFKNKKKLKVDNSNWKEYNKSNELKSEGLIKFGTYTNCCFAGPCKLSYLYKQGRWKYFYKSGTLKALGTYETKIANIQTSCSDKGDNVIVQKVAKDWTYFDENGTDIEPSENLILELEKFHTLGLWEIY